MSCPVVPAIIPTSQAELVRVLSELRFVNEIQIDVVDGVFAPAVSWPYQPLGSPGAIKSHTDPFTLEVDLMTAQPVTAAIEWIKAGADMLVFHVESISLAAFTNFLERTPVTIGVSMSGDTSLETFLPYAEIADYVQLMGIRDIGAQGQPFDENIFDMIEIIKAAFPGKMISVDGSVNTETITRLKKAGVNRFVSGSAIMQQDDFEVAHRTLCKLVE